MTDQTQEPSEKSRRRPLVMISCFIFGVPLVLCAGVMTWYLGRQSAAADKVHQRIEDLSQRGEPVDDQSLQLFYEVATSENYTDQWVVMREFLDSKEFAESATDVPFHDPYDDDDNPNAVPSPGEDWPNRKLVDEFLQKWQAERDTNRRLAEAEYVNRGKPLRRPIEFQSVATLLPDTQAVRSMARLLMLEHAVALYDGDRQRGYECIRACRGLERSTYGEPIIVSQLVGHAIAAVASEMLQKSLEYDQLSDQQMDELAENLPTFAQLRDLFDMSFRGERAMMLPIFSDPEQAKQAIGMESTAGANLLTETRSSDALYYLDIMDEFLSLPRDDLGAFRDASRQVSDKLENDARNAGVLEQLDHAMTYMMIPAVGAYTNVMVRRAEHNSLVKLAMAVRKFEHEFDRWPKSLDELSQINVDASKLRAVNWPYGYRVENNGDAVLWGMYRTTTLTLPVEPPPIDGTDEHNAAWVWRLRR